MKYKILKDEFVDRYKKRLYRIVKIDTGEKGGFVESENNLSQSGNAWVSGDAWVSGNAKIEKTTDYILYGPLGSRESFITVCKEQNLIMTGCFCGTKEEFLESVTKTHGDNEHGINYRRFIDFVFNGKTL